MNAAVTSPWRRLRFTRLRDLLRGRLDGSLDWRGVIETSGLPAELAQIVYQVVRRTRLWRSERVAVASELASHFRDGLDAGQSPEELAASFGDVTAAAKLVRRAKKRGRPLWWHAWRWCFWGVAALLSAYVFLWARMWWGRPEVAVDNLAELNRRAAAVAPDEAAWPVYVAGLRDLGWGDSGPPPGVDWAAMPDAATNPQFATFATQHRETFAQMREATHRPGLGAVLSSVGDYQTELLWTRVPLRTVDVFRRLMVLFQADARLAVSQGDLDRAVSNTIALLNLSNQIQEHSFLSIGYLASSLHELAYVEVKHLVDEHRDELTGAQLTALAHAAAGVQFDWEGWVEGEKVFARDFIQHLYTDDGAGDGRITIEGLELLRRVVEPMVMDVDGRGWSSAPRPYDVTWWQQFSTSFDGEVFAAPLAMASRRDVTDVLDRFYDEASEQGRRPLFLWERGTREADDIVSHWSQRERLKYYPLTLILPAWGVVLRQTEKSRGAQDGMLVGLALEVYRRDHGAWPATLEDLSPAYLPRVPVDRMNGKPLGYVVRDDRPVVYSVGSDLDDDGGRAVTGTNNEWLASPDGYGVSTPYNNDGDWILWGGEEVKEDGAKAALRS